MSVQLAILNFVLRYGARPFIKHTRSPKRARRDLERMAHLVFRGPHRGAQKVDLGGVTALRYAPNGAPQDKVLLYLHGGGYVAGSATSHLPMIGALARQANVTAVLPNYRLAPEHPFPAAFDDALVSWQALRQSGYESQNIILGGDSAGGGLALALLGHLVGEGELPAGLFAFSPWTDLTLTGASLKTNAGSEVTLPVERIQELREMVVSPSDVANPKMSPLFADFTGAPPIYIQASECEILRDDSVRLVERLRTANVDVAIDLWPKTPHVWQMFRRWIPEADDALDRTAAFIKKRLKS